MMDKICIANTPLILPAEDGSPFRVEAGAQVVLSAEQYALVAAHVTVTGTAAADAPATEPSEPAEPAPEADAAAPAATRRRKKAE